MGLTHDKKFQQHINNKDMNTAETLTRMTKKVIQKDQPREMVTIHRTTNYDRFSTILQNRPISKAHVAHIMESMKEAVLFGPVIVNEKGQVIDGQHRLTACRELGVPVSYVVMEGYGLKEVMQYNKSLKSWTLDDFIRAYAKSGNTTYQTFLKISEATGFKTTPLARVIVKNASKNFTTNVIKSGKMSLRYSYDEAIEKLNMILEAKDAIYKKNPIMLRMNGLEQTISALMSSPNYDHEKMLSKIEMYPGEIFYANAKQFSILFEEIFNYKSRNKVPLRFTTNEE